MKKSNKTSLIISMVVLVITLACLVTTGTTFAIWQRKVSTTQQIQVPVSDYNASLKNLIFAGLNDAKEFVTTGITQYAVVGYDGLVAEVIIPSTYNGLYVTMITTDSTQTENRFSNNEVVSSLVIAGSVTTITAGTFQAMTSLKSITFLEYEGNATTEEEKILNMGDFAFGNCTSLITFTNNRTISGDSSSYFWGTQIVI